MSPKKCGESDQTLSLRGVSGHKTKVDLDNILQKMVFSDSFHNTNSL